MQPVAFAVSVYVGALGKRSVHRGHGIPVLTIAILCSRHELHEGVDRPLVLGIQRNGHEVGVILAIEILQGLRGDSKHHQHKDL